MGSTAGIAIGLDSRVGDGHIDSVALGRFARTTAQDQFVFGTSARNFTIGIDSEGRRIAYRDGSTAFGGLDTTRRSTYRFAGFAIAEDDLDLAAEFVRVTAAEVNAATTDVARKALYDRVASRDAEVSRLRGMQQNRVIGVNGHGDLVSLGNVGDFGLSAADRTKLDASDTRSQANARAISDLQGMVGSNRELASQGVALSNALSAIPNTLDPGKKLRLGIGVGSFDGKSATAIGVTGKFGASTLNAGFSSGGGETSTRMGISWQW